MPAIDYHPLIQAVIDSWRARLPRDPGGCPPEVTEADLMNLVQELCKAFKTLAEDMDSVRRLFAPP